MKGGKRKALKRGGEKRVHTASKFFNLQVRKGREEERYGEGGRNAPALTITSRKNWERKGSKNSRERKKASHPPSLFLLPAWEVQGKKRKEKKRIEKERRKEARDAVGMNRVFKLQRSFRRNE